MFHPIDRAAWPREPWFVHYAQNVPCTYSLTARLDVTAIQHTRTKLYPALLYLLTEAVNRFAAFRTAFNSEGVLGVYDNMHPSYTIFHRDTQTFSNLWTLWQPSYPQFLQAYLEDQARYGGQSVPFPKPGTPENTFPVSMLPWTDFQGFNLNLQKGFDFLLPIFTLGKRTQDATGRWSLPIAIQVHHAVCDGFHVSQFLDCLQQEADTFEKKVRVCL